MKRNQSKSTAVAPVAPAFSKESLRRPDVEHTLAIDVHGHYGPYFINPGEIHKLRAHFYSGDAKCVVERATAVRTQWTIVSPLRSLLPCGNGQVLAGNREATKTVRKVPGLLQWVVIDPNVPKSYEQARIALRSDPWCVGIKIHPEMHQYPIRRYGRELFEFAHEERAVVMAHSGDKFSLPGDYVPFANDFPGTRIILAHLGNGCDGDPTHQVRAIQASRHGNLYTDTSSAQSIMPRLIEWGVKQVGAEMICYGTDTPLYAASMQRARVDLADITDAQKRKILRENAVKLLGLDRRKITR
jgi:hypothetical protein